MAVTDGRAEDVMSAIYCMYIDWMLVMIRRVHVCLMWVAQIEYASRVGCVRHVLAACMSIQVVYLPIGYCYKYACE